MVGDELHLAAVAISSEVPDLAREGAERWFEPLDGRRIAAGVHDKVLDGGLCAGARHWAVERRVAGLAQDALNLALVVERQGTGFCYGSGGGRRAGNDGGCIEHRARGR